MINRTIIIKSEALDKGSNQFKNQLQKSEAPDNCKPMPYKYIILRQRNKAL